MNDYRPLNFRADIASFRRLSCIGETTKRIGFRRKWEDAVVKDFGRLFTSHKARLSDAIDLSEKLGVWISFKLVPKKSRRKRK